MGKTEEIIGERRQVEMLRYLENHLNEDGGGVTSRDTARCSAFTRRASLLGKPSSAPSVERRGNGSSIEVGDDADAVVGEVLARRARRVRMEWTQPGAPGVLVASVLTRAPDDTGVTVAWFTFR